MRRAALSAAFAALLLTAPGAAPAEEGALGAELERLGGAAGALGQELRLAQAAPDASRQLAGIVARLGQIEEELRRLRGRIDEVEFRQQQAAAQPAPAAPPAETAGAGTGQTGAGAGAALPGAGTLGTVRSPAAGSPAPAGPPPVQTARLDPNAPPRDQYEAALQLLQSGDWPAAETAFDGFVKRFPNDPLASNAAYWLGETHYIRKDYANAAAIFARNYRSYGAEAQKAPDNLLKLGMSLAALGDRERACQTFAELDRRHANAATPVRQTLVRERRRRLRLKRTP